MTAAPATAPVPSAEDAPDTHPVPQAWARVINEASRRLKPLGAAQVRLAAAISIKDSPSIIHKHTASVRLWIDRIDASITDIPAEHHHDAAYQEIVARLVQARGDAEAGDEAVEDARQAAAAARQESAERRERERQQSPGKTAPPIRFRPSNRPKAPEVEAYRAHLEREADVMGVRIARHYKQALAQDLHPLTRKRLEHQRDWWFAQYSSESIRRKVERFAVTPKA